MGLLRKYSKIIKGKKQSKMMERNKETQFLDPGEKKKYKEKKKKKTKKKTINIHTD